MKKCRQLREQEWHNRRACNEKQVEPAASTAAKLSKASPHSSMEDLNVVGKMSLTLEQCVDLYLFHPDEVKMFGEGLSFIAGIHFLVPRLPVEIH